MEDGGEDASLLVFDVVVDESEMCFDNCIAQFFSIILGGNQAVIEVIGGDWVHFMSPLGGKLT